MDNNIDLYNIKPFGKISNTNIPIIPMNTIHKNTIDVEDIQKNIDTKNINQLTKEYYKYITNLISEHSEKYSNKAKKYYGNLKNVLGKYANKLGYDKFKDVLMKLWKKLPTKEIQPVQGQDSVVENKQDNVIDDKKQKVVKKQDNVVKNKQEVVKKQENIPNQDAKKQESDDNILEYKVNVKYIPQFMKLWNEYKNATESEKATKKGELDEFVKKFDENDDYVVFTTDKNVNRGLNDLYDTLRKNEKYFGNKEFIESMKAEKPKEFMDYIVEGWRSIFDKENLEKEKQEEEKKKEKETEEKLKDYYMSVMGLKKYEGTPKLKKQMKESISKGKEQGVVDSSELNKQESQEAGSDKDNNKKQISFEDIAKLAKEYKDPNDAYKEIMGKLMSGEYVLPYDLRKYATSPGSYNALIKFFEDMLSEYTGRKKEVKDKSQEKKQEAKEDVSDDNNNNPKYLSYDDIAEMAKEYKDPNDAYKEIMGKFMSGEYVLDPKLRGDKSYNDVIKDFKKIFSKYKRKEQELDVTSKLNRQEAEEDVSDSNNQKYINVYDIPEGVRKSEYFDEINRNLIKNIFKAKF